LASCLNAKSRRSTRCYKKLNSAPKLIQRTTSEAPQRHMYFIGLDVHKKTISYCVKDAAGRVHQEGKIGSTRRELTAGFGLCRSPARSPWKQRSLPAILGNPSGRKRTSCRSHNSATNEALDDGSFQYVSQPHSPPMMCTHRVSHRAKTASRSRVKCSGPSTETACTILLFAQRSFEYFLASRMNCGHLM
jgi:hypothetical protein